MQPKFIATITTDAADLEEAARDLAIAIVTAVEADDGSIVLVGPLSPIISSGST
jgi:hypothetical protein